MTRTSSTTTSQLARAIVSIREMILQGELVPGERVAEAPVARRLGMSRTPVRQALPSLAREGLLEAAGPRGYVVRAIRPVDVGDALDLRGVVEGLAVRRIAEQGLSFNALAALRECLAEGDAVLAVGRSALDEAAYARMNARFHEVLLREAGMPLLAEVFDRIGRVPYSSPLNLAFDGSRAADIHDLLAYAHRQHHTIVAALERREVARVESLAREHAHLVKESLNLHPVAAPGNHAAAPVRADGPGGRRRVLSARSTPDPRLRRQTH
jgi:GntR family transcriptional regulator, vanillate catabolism transcriptional regulator